MVNKKRVKHLCGSLFFIVAFLKASYYFILNISAKKCTHRNECIHLRYIIGKRTVVSIVKI